MRPNSIFTMGNTYYFTIVVKEKNSDTVLYPYYATVKVNGEAIDLEEYYKFNVTVVNYTINYIDESSKGSLKFNNPINMTWMEENFYDLFKIYWRDTVYS